ncbi:protein of unknown function [Robiginitalea myxolifaciens]|uniref:MrfA-like Zn-binding domain-containing protein n=1 Tax=Robiginitalea myxolifaciens TaxID=400055 RepID=A0A1I6G0X5_9FLAO|nr:DUF1998 domain-containing protein [Robiginitalea myxolifaciens]SFR35812.1 protein of unknown function [Robiginitalea myxolifaciens]
MEQEIRTSQALHTYGPGSIADFPDLSLIVLCHDMPQPGGTETAADWGENTAVNQLEDDRLAIAFNVDYFVSPPLSDSPRARVQTTRFPTLLQCPDTGELFDVRQLEQEERNYTDFRSRERKTVDETFKGYNSPIKRERKLIPIRFVIATEDGHLDNFPFDWYVHVKANKLEEIGKGNRLFLRSRGGTASLRDLIIESKSPRDGSLIARVSLEKIFDQEDTFVDLNDRRKDYLSFVGNRMPLPWRGRGKRTSDGISDFQESIIGDVSWPAYSINSSQEEKNVALSKYPRTLQRGAGNLYFPIVYKGISIPKSGYDPMLPESFILDIKRNYDNLENAGFLDDTESKLDKFISLYRINIYRKLDHSQYTLDEAVRMIKKLFKSESEKTGQLTTEELRLQEFRCFLNPAIRTKRKEWYDSEIIDGSHYVIQNRKLIHKVVLLNKLRELKIFRGFTRIRPLMFEDLIFDLSQERNLSGRRRREANRIQDPRFRRETRTLPATEVRGEGIFIQFDDQFLQQWENREEVRERFETISGNFQHYRRTFDMEDDHLLTPRYVALHTFSHLIINELAIECGYGSSALSEIIYCSSPGSEIAMNGILIYTSSSDSEGTLGGLVEKGNVRILSEIAENALSKAAWCSSDPLCIENQSGRGFMGVNLAACHSCCLLPETSCCNLNKFLDRGLVIGTLDKPDIGLFS